MLKTRKSQRPKRKREHGPEQVNLGQERWPRAVRHPFTGIPSLFTIMVCRQLEVSPGTKTMEGCSFLGTRTLWESSRSSHQLTPEKQEGSRTGVTAKNWSPLSSPYSGLGSRSLENLTLCACLLITLGFTRGWMHSYFPESKLRQIGSQNLKPLCKLEEETLASLGRPNPACHKGGHRLLWEGNKKIKKITHILSSNSGQG